MRLGALAVPSHVLSGAARKAGLIDGDDSDIHAFGEFAESPFDNLLRASPPFKLGIGPIGQQGSGDVFAVACRGNGAVYTGK